LYTTRGFDSSRPDGWERTKYRDMNLDPVTTPDGEKTSRSSMTVLELRAFFAGEMNRIAERGCDVLACTASEITKID
jgi:hypothetical protein